MVVMKASVLLGVLWHPFGTCVCSSEKKCSVVTCKPYTWRQQVSPKWSLHVYQNMQHHIAEGSKVLLIVAPH
jgi:hypothetical protein